MLSIARSAVVGVAVAVVLLTVIVMSLSSDPPPQPEPSARSSAAPSNDAEVLAAKPISSLVACKRVITAPLQEQIAAARERENQCFVELMGGPANTEALAAFAEGRPPNFTDLPPGW